CAAGSRHPRRPMWRESFAEPAQPRPLAGAAQKPLNPASPIDPRSDMPRRLISTGSPLEKSAGYSRAVADGDFAFVAGTTRLRLRHHGHAGRCHEPVTQLL